MSQKVSAMRAAGLVRTVQGADARSKKVTLTAKAKRIVELLAAEWRATEAAIAELETEIPYPMTQVVPDIEEALARKSFHDRIAEKLEQQQMRAHALIDLEPLRASRPFRRLWAGQVLSTFGGQLAFVAVTFQVWIDVECGVDRCGRVVAGAAVDHARVVRGSRSRSGRAAAVPA